MSSNVETLMEMGFPRNRAEKALHVTQYKSVQVAMDWLFAHSDDPDIDDPFEAPKGHKLGDSSTPSQEGGDASQEAGEGESTDGTSQETAPAQAKSLKCDECGKRLRTSTDVQVHAARTGHQSFSESEEEIKPLTEEEKKEQVARIQQKLEERQRQKREQEKKEAIEKEKLRRKQGRDMVNAKQQHEMDEMKRLADLKKREKLEDKLARQRVKEQIARDRADRAAKSNPPQQTTSTVEKAPSTSPPAAAAPKKDYDSARLQIRLTNGSLTNSFGAAECLAAVRLYVELNRTDGASEPFTLMTPFPRKVFTEDDMEKPLKELGLVPSAVLTVTRPQ
ncbi:UBX domain-containing protein 1-like [Amphiura filiformis]|uniref:UBX domain-containing protein 1-like n=1 Tax=Amphiura filiformis TaxID=82378 RepID=UPI003B21704B